MRNFQQNLLVVLALGLCGLCARQWYQETGQRTDMDALNHLVYDQDAAIQRYTNAIAALNHQVNQLDAGLTELKGATRTNEQFFYLQKAEMAQLRSDNASQSNEIKQYQSAVDTLQAKLKEAYGGIERQNGTISNLLAQRGELVQKFNDEVKDRNEIVARYNDLAKQMQAAEKAPGK